nr:leucine rich repeat neuronal protein 2 [Hymenolepis microstoma]
MRPSTLAEVPPRLIGCTLLILLVIIKDIYAHDSTRGPSTLWNLHGTQDFYPCRFIKSTPSSDDADAILCDNEASNVMGNSIPTIHPEGKIIREIRFNAGSRLSTLPGKVFEKVGSNLRRLFIEGGEIRVIKREALSGLSELQILEIRNAADAERHGPNNGLAGRLFTADGELKHLKRIRRLVLENVDLSDGLAAYALYEMSRSLEELIFRGNNLETINPYTFEKSESVKSLKFMSLERQKGSLAWLKSANRWARDLGGLNMLSLSGNNLTEKTLDFGYSMNAKLRAIKIENCSLTEVPNELLKNFASLEEIYAGKNRFTIISTEEATDKLCGLRRFTNLTKLSLSGNLGLIYKQPTWFRNSKITELDYSGSLLRKIGARELPKSLEILHLESTFLEEIEKQWAFELAHFKKLHLNSSSLKAVKINGTEGDWEAALEPLKQELKHLSLAKCNIISKSLNSRDDEDYKVTGLRLGLQNLQALESLDLSGNYLTHIPLNAFRNMTNLISLNLSDNLLQTLTNIEHNSTTTGSIPKIKELDLTNNGLTSVIGKRRSMGFSVSLDKMLDNDARVKLSGNPIICDCRIRWLLEGGIQVDNFTCLGKNALTGKGFDELNFYDLANNQSTCTTWDFIHLPDPTYPFRPVRVFAYDKKLKRIYFTVKGSALKSAWEKIARKQPAKELQKVLAQLNNLTPETISKLQKDYIIFEVKYWPVGEGQEIKKTDWQVLDEGLMRSDGGQREYVFYVDSIDVKRPHTVCFINALDRRNDARSTLCQIFQPSELTMTAKLENPNDDRIYAHAPLWLVVLVTVSIITFMIYVLYLCVKHKNCQKKAGSQKDKTVPIKPQGYSESQSNSSDSQYDKLENYYLENSLQILNAERPELPKRTKSNRALLRPPKTSTSGSLGDLSTRRYKSRIEKRLKERHSTSKLPLGSPRLPRPLIYQRPITINQQGSVDDNGYVKMNADDDDDGYLEARPEKRIRRDISGNDEMLDSYIMGVPGSALRRQKSTPTDVSLGIWTSPKTAL